MGDGTPTLRGRRDQQAQNRVNAPHSVSHELVDAISSHKNEPDWMRKFRHKSLEYFNARPLPRWGGDVTGIEIGRAHV